ncbi:MAG: hypothetical protein OXE82_11030 [Rhodobacter sp.]|nr:hypothetical protein [Rhodobacter sp.]
MPIVLLNSVGIFGHMSTASLKEPARERLKSNSDGDPVLSIRREVDHNMIPAYSESGPKWGTGT